MKKILKKLFIVALAIGVLTPYIEIPIVKASNCSEHVQHYLFLDQNILRVGNKTLFEYYSSDDSVNSTIFPYEFPVGENVDITNIIYNELERNGEIDEFIELHDTVIEYAENKTQNEYRFYRSETELYGDAFVSNNERGFDSSTILLHGYWGSYDENFEPQENNWDIIDENVEAGYVFSNYSLQNTPLIDYMVVNMYKGVFSGSKAVPTRHKIDEGNSTDLDYLVNTSLEELEEDDYLIWDEKDFNNQDVNKYFLPIVIHRDLYRFNGFGDDVVFGYHDGTSLYAFGETSVSNPRVSDIKNSYTRYKAFVNSGEEYPTAYIKQITAGNLPTNAAAFNENPSNYGVAFNTNGSYYWPFILTVEYETCSNSNSGTPWELIYDGNYDNAKNIPDPVPNIPAGDSVKLAAAPKREGYTFKKWCLDKEGKTSCYDAETNFKNETGASKVTLYATWGDTNGSDNKDTGVFSYVISFIAVGAIAGTIYYVSKKKNLFKQI